MFTPDNITELEHNHIFVFGSNWQWNHAGWAAKIAKEKFWAIEWQSEWMQWQSYGINTMDWIEKIKKWIEKLIKYACDNTTKIFLVTKLWCWIAWYKEEEIKALFDTTKLPANIVLPFNRY